MSIRSKEGCHNKEVAILFDDRDLILHKLNDAIFYLHNKALKGRVTDAKNEKVRIAWFKALAYSCSIYNQIKRDVELDQLREEVETLKNHIEMLDDLPKEKEAKNGGQLI